MAQLVRVFLFVAILLASPKVHAGFFTGSIQAHFANPVLSGYVYGGGYYNNTTTARYSFHGSSTSTAVNWGTNSGGPGSSTLIFAPNQNVAVASDTTFSLGTFTYFNGTSQLNSLIFGVNLILDFIPSGGGPAVDTLVIPIGIGTTSNVGNAASDADFISVPGIANAFFAFEGLGASALLNGQIVGDPYFVPESFTVLEQFTIYTGPADMVPYDPADYTTYDSPGFAAGFTAPTPSPVPEPNSLAILAGGVCSLLAFQMRRNRQRLVRVGTAQA